MSSAEKSPVLSPSDAALKLDCHLSRRLRRAGDLLVQNETFHATVQDLVTDNGDIKIQVYLYFGPTAVYNEDATLCDSMDTIRLDMWNYQDDLVEGLELPIGLQKTYGAMQYNGFKYITVSGQSDSGMFVIRKFDVNNKQFSIEAQNVTFRDVDGNEPNVTLSGMLEGTW